MKYLVLIFAIIGLISCQEASKAPTLPTSELITTKTPIDQLGKDDSGDFSKAAVKEQELATFLLELAKQGTIEAFKHVGPWGDSLVSVSPNAINEILTVELETIVDGEVVTSEKKLTPQDFGSITFKEKWLFDSAKNQLTKNVYSVTFTELVLDEDDLPVGDRPLLTVVLQ